MMISPCFLTKFLKCNNCANLYEIHLQDLNNTDYSHFLLLKKINEKL